MDRLTPLIHARLARLTLLPELREAFQRMATYDLALAGERHWGMVIPAIQEMFGGAAQAVAPFEAAWTLMYAATSRLDHLQDGDPVDDPLPVQAPSAQYNLIMSYYVLANGLLDLLSADLLPAHRIPRLRRLWTDMILRMASGQQRDLGANAQWGQDDPLTYYQQLAQAKTGASYALAFGGTASLLSDDPGLIDALTAAGELFGTLIQLSDDLADAAEQQGQTITFPAAFAQVRPPHLSDHTAAAFGSYLYEVYSQYAAQLLAGLPTSIQAGVLALFERTFAPAAAGV